MSDLFETIQERALSSMTCADGRVVVECVWDAGLAEALIAANVANRTVKVREVETLRRKMEQGLYRAGADTVSIAESGRLLDGQNRNFARLQAPDADVPSQLIVIVPDAMASDAQINTDVGSKRTFGDVLRMRYHVTDQNTHASVTRVLWEYDAGNPWWRGDFKKKPIPSLNELEGYWLKHEAGIRHSVSVGRRAYDRTRLNATACAAAHFLFCRIDGEDSAEFFGLVSGSGSGLDDGNPILALRGMAARWPNHQRPSAHRQLAVLIKAWNKWRDSEFTAQLKAPRAGESFPRPY